MDGGDQGSDPGTPNVVRSQRRASVPVVMQPTGQPRWLGTICPYLRAADGTWRSAVPTREHRCWALDPPSALPTATQQELCLTEAHAGCERFLSSRERRAASLAQDQIEVGRLESARFGAFISPVPVAVDPRPAPAESGRGGRTTRRRIPGLIVAGGVVLVGIVALAAIFGGGRLPFLAAASPSPRPSVSVAPVVTAAPTPVPTPIMTSSPRPTVIPTGTAAAPTAASSTPTRTPAPTRAAPSQPAPTPSARPARTPAATPVVPIARKYTVKEGDTLKSIANKFGLKPRDLRAVNDIGKEVVVGQRLLIPEGPVPTPAATPTAAPTPSSAPTPKPTRASSDTNPQS
jgi:LysM repeat protein